MLLNQEILVFLQTNLFCNSHAIEWDNQIVKKRETYQRKLIAALHRELASFQYLLFGFQDKVTIIVNVSSESQQEAATQKLKKVEKLWTNKEAPVLTGGIGMFYQGLEYVARSFEEANKSLSYISNRGTPGIISYESIGINRLFINQQAEDIQQFIQEVFHHSNLLRPSQVI